MHTCAWNKFHKVVHSKNLGKPNKLKVFGSKRIKGPKHDRQNVIRQPMTDLSFNKLH